jgi:transposase
MAETQCRQCDWIVQEPAAHRPIDRGLAGPGLLAHVLIANDADHLPLYRQSEIYEREGVELDRSTLADWGWRPAARWNLWWMRCDVLEADKLHGDDIPGPVLAPVMAKRRQAAVDLPPIQNMMLMGVGRSSTCTGIRKRSPAAVTAY